MRETGLIAIAVIFVVIAFAIFPSKNTEVADFYDASTHLAQRSGLNLIGGDGITVTGVDDATNNRVNMTIATTEASGTATVTASNLFVMVTHGLGSTPDRVLLTPTTDPADAAWYVSAKNATQFAITLVAVHSSDITFDWLAIKE